MHNSGFWTNSGRVAATSVRYLTRSSSSPRTCSSSIASTPLAPLTPTMAANMLAAATSTLGYLAGAKSSALSAYAIQGAGAGHAGQGERAVRVGVWKVMRAKHRTTGREVSVWVGEKRAGPAQAEVVERMKREVSCD